MRNCLPDKSVVFFTCQTCQHGLMRLLIQLDDKVVFCTGGSGSICSGMVRALVALGANACIVGRNADKARSVAADIANVRAGSTVLGIGEVDVRTEASMKAAVETCLRDLGRIDFVM